MDIPPVGFGPAWTYPPPDLWVHGPTPGRTCSRMDLPPVGFVCVRTYHPRRICSCMDLPPFGFVRARTYSPLKSLRHGVPAPGGPAGLPYGSPALASRVRGLFPRNLSSPCLAGEWRSRLRPRGKGWTNFCASGGSVFVYCFFIIVITRGNHKLASGGG